jgi:Imidazolonepropionase and related amidohydrolases
MRDSTSRRAVFFDRRARTSATFGPSTARDPFTSTYQAAPATATLIRGATVLTGTGTRVDGGDVLIVNGRIEAVGNNLHAPEGANVIDAAGRWVTPGIIDIHSHLGVYPSPQLKGLSDGNELTIPSPPMSGLNIRSGRRTPVSKRLLKAA